jgi:mRNA interferase RelE/StbE
MAAYEVFFKQSVWKELRRMPKRELSRVLARIKQLGNTPRPSGCEKLSGE